MRRYQWKLKLKKTAKHAGVITGWQVVLIQTRYCAGSKAADLRRTAQIGGRVRSLMSPTAARKRPTTGTGAGFLDQLN